MKRSKQTNEPTQHFHDDPERNLSGRDRKIIDAMRKAKHEAMINPKGFVRYGSTETQPPPEDEEPDYNWLSFMRR